MRVNVHHTDYALEVLDRMALRLQATINAPIRLQKAPPAPGQPSTEAMPPPFNGGMWKAGDGCKLPLPCGRWEDVPGRGGRIIDERRVKPLMEQDKSDRVGARSQRQAIGRTNRG